MERNKFWAGIGITAGLAIFFFGVTETGNNLGIAWLDIAMGVIMIGTGLGLARKAGMFKKS